MARFERILFAIGFALLAAWGTATLGRVVFSCAAIAKFDTNKATHAGSKRVQAYQARLLEKIDAPLAVLCIPKIQLEVPVFDGTDDLTLNRGVGRIVGTAQVGAGGNLGIAGHRDGFFRGLKDVAQGDVIELARSGQTDVYIVDRTRTTKPEDVSVLKPTPKPSLTLVTCFPFHYVGSAPMRYIVRASLWIPSQSARGDSISKGRESNNKVN
jgi:sortase A